MFKLKGIREGGGPGGKLKNPHCRKSSDILLLLRFTTQSRDRYLAIGEAFSKVSEIPKCPVSPYFMIWQHQEGQNFMCYQNHEIRPYNFLQTVCEQMLIMIYALWMNLRI